MASILIKTAQKFCKTKFGIDEQHEDHILIKFTALRDMISDPYYTPRIISGFKGYVRQYKQDFEQRADTRPGTKYYYAKDAFERIDILCDRIELAFETKQPIEGYVSQILDIIDRTLAQARQI